MEFFLIRFYVEGFFDMLEKKFKIKDVAVMRFLRVIYYIVDGVEIKRI